MIIITNHTELNTLKVWKDVKAFDRFKNSLETNRDVAGKLRYFLVLDKDIDEFFVQNTFSIGSDTIKTYEKQTSTNVVSKCRLVNFLHFDVNDLPSHYDQSEIDKINVAKTFSAYKEIENGLEEAPSGYPVVKNVEICEDVQEVKEENILVSSAKVREIL